jgi:eukaryotic-like serine/threonine-protein kinase
VALSPSIEDKYEVLAKLSEGGMGAIYKVRHRLLDEVRVIKVVLRHAGPAGELRDRFLGEARTASRLIHPNLARILDFLIDEQEQQLLVMEHIDGPTLQQVLDRSGPPPLGLALEIARQALEALGALHRYGFVHRDVAPDNLMLTRDAAGGPLVKLIDFGIAKALVAGPDRDPALTQAGVFLGKPRYASPEQLTGEPVDARSDLYSFGLVLYELLTGRCPFEGHSIRELIAAHLQAEPLSFAMSDPDGLVPPGLRAVVLRLLAKHPEDRFADDAELAEALSPFAAPWPPEALDEILIPPAASPLTSISPEVPQETHRSAEPVAPPSLTALRRRSRPGARLNPASLALGIAAVILLGLLVLWAVRARSRGETAAATTPPAGQPSSTSTPAPVLPPSGDLPPRPLDQPQAVYPEKALAFGIPVRVTVDLTVDDRGRVVKAAAPFMDAEQPVPSHLFRSFRSAALKAARALRFQPATRDGKPVKKQVRLIIEVKP